MREVTTQVSAPKMGTAWISALKKKPYTRGIAPYLLRIRDILLQTVFTMYKFFTTAVLPSSVADITRPRYLKEVTISRGLPKKLFKHLGYVFLFFSISFFFDNFGSLAYCKTFPVVFFFYLVGRCYCFIIYIVVVSAYPILGRFLFSQSPVQSLLFYAKIPDFYAKIPCYLGFYV